MKSSSTQLFDPLDNTDTTFFFKAFGSKIRYVIGLLVIKRNLKVLSIPHISLNVDLIVNTMLTCLYV